MRIDRLSRIAIVTFLAATSAQASVILVNANGFGDFTDIQAAVDAAVDGDTLLVKAGNYTGALIVGKELAIVADTNSNVIVNGALRVRGIPVGKHVLLAGLKLKGEAGTPSTDRNALYLKLCAGSVRVEDCELFGTNATVTEFFLHTAVVEDCSDVGIVRSTLQSFDNAGGDGVHATNSSIAIYDSTVVGGDSDSYGHSGGGNGDPGGDGFHGKNSFLFSAGSQFTGSHGGDTAPSPAQCVCGGLGGSGVSLGTSLWPDSFDIIEPSTAVVLDTVATGAPGGVGVSGACGACGECSHCHGASGHPYLGTRGLTSLPGTARRLLGPNLMREGTSTTVHFVGEPGDEVALFIGSEGDFDLSLPAHGTYLVERPAKRIRIGQVGAHGVFEYPFTAPTLANGEASRTMFLQSLHKGTDGQYTLGSPLTIVVVDSAF